jgi:hypothetical protein
MPVEEPSTQDIGIFKPSSLVSKCAPQLCENIAATA